MSSVLFNGRAHFAKRKLYRSDYKTTEIATLASVSLFEKAGLIELLTSPKDKLACLNSNQNVKEQLTLFFRVKFNVPVIIIHIRK